MLEDEKENLFANSLFDATIQDSDIRERNVDVISPKAIEKIKENIENIYIRVQSIL